MNFAFELSHFQMDSRESILAMKNLQRLSPAVLELVISELQAGNVVTDVVLFGDNEIQAMLRDPFRKEYNSQELVFSREIDPHYRGDFYRLGNHSVVAPLV